MGVGTTIPLTWTGRAVGRAAAESTASGNEGAAGPLTGVGPAEERVQAPEHPGREVRAQQVQVVVQQAVRDGLLVAP